MFQRSPADCWFQVEPEFCRGASGIAPPRCIRKPACKRASQGRVYRTCLIYNIPEARVCKTRLLTFHRMLRNVNAICISAKNVVSLQQRRGESLQHGAFSSFLAHYEGKKTSDVEKFLREIEFFLSASGFFLGEVGARIADVGFPKVKRYLFSNPAFFTFWGSTQVVFFANNSQLSFRSKFRLERQKPR